MRSLSVQTDEYREGQSMSTLVGTVILGSTLFAVLLGQITAGAEVAGVVIGSVVLMTLRGA
jgi:hypothetical protein